MAGELVQLFPTGKTVTVTVTIDGAAATTPSVTESTGVYSADYTNATAGLAHIMWNNTTDSLLVHETLYWDGSAFHVTQKNTPLEIRDAVDTISSAGKRGLTVQINNSGIVSKRV